MSQYFNVFKNRVIDLFRAADSDVQKAAKRKAQGALSVSPFLANLLTAAI